MSFRKIFYSKLLHFSLFVSLSPCLSYANNETTADNSTTVYRTNFNPQVFSLSKKKESTFDAPSAIYVLTSEDIRRSGLTSIPEVLRLVPGLQVARIDGNQWAISVRGFNRQFSNKLLVMVDGRIVYTYLFSGVDWDIQDYVLEDIDRIEVLRGPQTMWGTSAVDGVINIITKSAVQTQGAFVSQIAGNQDKSITEARYGGETKQNNHYRVYAKNVVRDGVDRYDTRGDNHDGTKSQRAGFRYDVSSIKDSSITIHGDAFHTTTENIYNTLKNNEKNDKVERGGNLVVSWDQKLSNKSTFNLETYLDYEAFHIPVLSRSAKTLDIDFQHVYSFSDVNQFTWGLGYRQIMDDSNSNRISRTINAPINYYPTSRNDQLYSAFLQDKIGLSEEVYLTIGSKFLINDFTGFEFQPSARIAYYPSGNQTLWVAVSRAVRLPTRSEMGAVIYGQNTNNVINKGSSEFQAEELIAYEAGYKIKPTRRTLIDAAVFYNDYSNLRTFESVGSPTLAPSTSPKASNYGYGESYGVELTGRWQVNDDWKLEANYDFLSVQLHIQPYSTDNRSKIALFNSLEVSEGVTPQSQFKLKSFYNISPKWEFDNTAYYVGGLNKAGAGGYKAKGIPSYIRLDTRLGYIPTRNWDFSVAIQNLLNQVHSEFSGGLYNTQTIQGRTFYFKVVWQY